MSSSEIGRRGFIQSAAWMSAALMAGECLGGRLKVTGPSGAPMQGFALKPMKKVRVACIGVGSRGTSALRRLSQVPGTVVTAVADLFQDRIDKELDWLKKNGKPAPVLTLAGPEGYKRICESDAVDVVYNVTPWHMHAPIALYAMEHGKVALNEVPGALTIDECWQLVETSERTRIPCMMLENCCYGETEMALYDMVDKGQFGELVHMQGAYAHDLRDEITHGLINRHYRFRNFQHRNGELYPTHALGPLAKMLRINRGNRFLTLVSMASKSRGLNTYIKDKFGEDHEYAKINWCEGDIVTTLIKCANGETITLQHDDSLPRAYSRELRVQGDRGIYEEDGDRYIIDGKSEIKGWDYEWFKFSEDLPQNDHPLWKWFKEKGVEGGHGGMDYLVQRAFYESIMKGVEPPIDVYDTAAWMCITCLSEQSVSMGSMPVPIPDFTNGLWMQREEEPKTKYSLNKVHYDLFED